MHGQRIGYIRVSTLDQNPERQLEQVTADRTFTDHASGKDAERPQLAALLSFIGEGDTLVVHSMDRLARNLDDLRYLVQALTRNGVRVEFVKENLTFTGEDSPMATLSARWPGFASPPVTPKRGTSCITWSGCRGSTLLHCPRGSPSGCTRTGG